MRLLISFLTLFVILLVTQGLVRGADLPERPPVDVYQPRGISMLLRGRFPANFPFDQLHWQQDLWLIVQWQDGAGSWQTVTGWQGHFDDIQYQDQWIGQKWIWADDPLAGSGPYRWLLLDTHHQRMVGASQPFYLPVNAGGLVVVDLAISP